MMKDEFGPAFAILDILAGNGIKNLKATQDKLAGRINFVSGSIQYVSLGVTDSKITIFLISEKSREELNKALITLADQRGWSRIGGQ